MKRCLLTTAVALAALAVSMPLSAVDTQRWELDGFKEWSRGEAHGVEIDSAGRLSPVWAADLEEVAAHGIWSMAETRGGLYIGTGNEGKLFMARTGSIKEIAATSHIAVTRIRISPQGAVYFSAIPEGTIYRLGKNDEVTKLVETGEPYVWDFLFEGNDIVAATGPKGKILRISMNGKIKDTIETGEQHVMCLLKAGDGKLYAGTSGDGLTLEVLGSKYRVVHDFQEKEVKRLAWVGSRAGVLLAAVNSKAGARPPAGPRPPAWVREKEKTRGEGEGDDKKDEEGGPPQVMIDRGPAPRGGGKVSGAVYAITDAGGARQLVELPKRAAVDMVTAGQDVYVATDQEGKVYRLSPDSSDYAIAFDLEPAQILSLVADEKGLLWMGTGSPAGLVKLKQRSMEKAGYISEVLDAQFPARWGEVSWQSDGPVRVLTRSGNIKDPERGWSGWQAVGLGQSGQIKSPDARYLQIKIEWPSMSRAIVTSLTVPYRVYNQPHFVDKVAIDSADQDGNGDPKKPGPRRRPNKRGTKPSKPGDHKTERKLMWKVTNPDNDQLEFKLYFQPDGEKQWIRIQTPEPITLPKFKWETASLPDGWYRIKVVATDAPANPAGEAIEESGISDRFLIDNRPPKIKSLSASRGKIKGEAGDDVSDISGVEFSIDGGQWMPAAPDDGLFDSNTEGFHAQIPDDIDPGLHIISVRAWDRALNMDVRQARSEK